MDNGESNELREQFRVHGKGRWALVGERRAVNNYRASGPRIPVGALARVPT